MLAVSQFNSKDVEAKLGNFNLFKADNRNIRKKACVCVCVCVCSRVRACVSLCVYVSLRPFTAKASSVWISWYTREQINVTLKMFTS